MADTEEGAEATPAVAPLILPPMNLPPPKLLVVDDNLARSWKQWKRSVLQFNITEDDLAPLLSHRTCIELGLVTINDCDSPSNSSGIKDTPSIGVTVGIPDLLEEYKDVFGGLGDLLGEYHILTDDTVPPVVHPPRRVPVALRDQEKLDEMVASGILAPSTEPTE